MGQPEPGLEKVLPIEQVVNDLAQCWKSTVPFVTGKVVELILDGNLTLVAKVQIPLKGIYKKRIDPITGKQEDTSEPATILRTFTFDTSAGPIESRLREAARDGLRAARPIKHDGHSFELHSLATPKDELIAALARERLDIPRKWRHGEIATPPESKTQSEAHTTSNRRIDALTAVIETAKKNATDSNDYHSVWAALVKLAESSKRPAPLLGHVDGEGVKYQGDSDVQFFKKDSLRKRMERAAR